MSDELFSFLSLPTGDSKLVIEQTGKTRFQVNNEQFVIGEYASLREAMNVVSAFLLGVGRYEREFCLSAKEINAYDVETFDPLHPEDV